MSGLAFRARTLVLGLLWASFSQSPFVQAQTRAVCSNSTFEWSFNSLGQSPCEMGEALGGVCSSNFMIQSLEADYYYSGFNPRFATPCVCNTVYYTLLSVCGECQGGYAEQFSLWSENCTTVYDKSFPKDIPSGTRVPHYAYLPLGENENIDLAALRADNGAEATAGGNNNGNNSSSSKKTPVGAIAGGVVGGVVFLGLVGGLIAFCLVRRRRNQRPPSQMVAVPGNAAAPYPSSSPYSASDKVYNPNDPNTFPQPVVPYNSQQGQQYPASPDRSSNLTPPSPHVNTSAYPSAYPPSPTTTTTTTTAAYPQSQTTLVQYQNSAGMMPPGIQTTQPQNYQPAPAHYSQFEAGSNAYGATPPADAHRQAYQSGVPQI